MTELKLYYSHQAMTPFFPEKGMEELRGLAVVLIKKAWALTGVFNPDTRDAISHLVEPMNSYYSNLIEGHTTHPLDIEKALKKNYSREPQKKLLQLESRAHVLVNRSMKVKIRTCSTAYESSFICWLHEQFYDYMPPEYKTVRTKTGKELKIIPGQLRDTEVEVGKHICPAAKALPHFMQFFEEQYSLKNSGDPVLKIIAIAASHHRLAWIHPFADGNGRVVRLLSEAALIVEKVDGEGLWSVSRGLARNNETYYAMLANADLPRMNDHDGRGNLSDRRLYEFCKFFMETCIDQADYMLSLLEPEKLLKRLSNFVSIMAARNELRQESANVLQEAVLKGKLARGAMPLITGKSENVARSIMNDLLKMELLISESDTLRSPVKINFPICYAPYIFPKLFPGDAEAKMMEK